jgi:hypothetical protein
MPPLRFQPPDTLPGATAFAKDDELRGSLNIVRLLKTQRWVWDGLRQACDLDKNWGRQREPGNWELVAVAFVASRYVDIQPWHDESSDELWRECGFEHKPHYRTAWRRLRELEGVCEAFLDSVGVLIRHARKHDKRVMAHVHFDNTEDETHAALVHDCERGKCPKAGKGSAAGRGRAGSGVRPQRQTTEAFREQRQKLNEEVPPETIRDPRLNQPEKVQLVRRGSRNVKRVLIGGCWYRTLDTEAGIRAYMGPRGARRFWHGYYSGKAVCHFAHGTIPRVENASRQEYDLFEDHYDRVCELIGAPPQTVVGDKGYSVASVFEKCTRNGTAPVFPWRPGGGDYKRHDKDTHDRHGVARCKHCGGPTSFVRFSIGDPTKPAEERNPRLWVRCLIGAKPECGKDQTIACSNDWRLLLPLWRTDPLYHELKESHGSYEGVHDYWRDRYNVAADNLANRPKARGIGWHRLRAYVASLIDWLRILAREGWLGSARRNHEQPERPHREAGERAAHRLADYRARIGIVEPYGDKAVELELGDRVPPSRRPRGAPPGQQTLDIEN